jgi:ATP-dependent DNA helicase RecG
VTASPALRLFLSSVQEEFAELRKSLKAHLLGDAELRRHLDDVFLFEELPAAKRSIDGIYLAELARCHLYLGLFGYDYASESEDGVSPTEREFDEATRLGKPRFVWVWGADESRRSPKMRRLIEKAKDVAAPRPLEDPHALRDEIRARLVDFLERREIPPSRPLSPFESAR